VGTCLATKTAAPNMPRLERLIGLLQDHCHELAKLQYRAPVVRDRHEPPAEKRVKAR